MRLVDVGGHRQPGRLFDPPQDGQPPFEPRATVGVGAGAIGLVERRLKDERCAGLGGNLLEPGSNPQRQLFSLDHARSGNDQQSPCRGRSEDFR